MKNKKGLLLIILLIVLGITSINVFAEGPGFETESAEVADSYAEFEEEYDEEIKNKEIDEDISDPNIPDEFLEEELVEEEVIIESAGITPDSPFYFVDEIADTFVLAMAEGEDKAEKAAEIAAEKVAEAKLMADKNLTAETLEALENANVSGLVEEGMSPEVEKLTQEKMEFIRKILAEMDAELPKDLNEIKTLIDAQKTQADKNQVAGKLATKIADLCDKLALEDYNLMLEEPRCDPDNAPEWLAEIIEEEIQKRQETSIHLILKNLKQCIEDPRKCNCDDIPVKSEKDKCIENSALAVRCEYEQDMKACNELDGKEEDFLEDLPEFMRDSVKETFMALLEEKDTDMFDKFAPPECKKAGVTTREDCENIMMEIHGPPPKECMEGGEFIGPEECDEIMNELYGPPDPECMDNGKFIGEEACNTALMAAGKIPQECIEGGEFVGWDNCQMHGEGDFDGEIAEQCLENGEFIGDEECKERLDEQMQRNKEQSPECYEGNTFIGDDACRAIMDELYGDEWAKAREESPECYEGDEFIGEEECKAIMEELHGDEWSSGKEDSPECYNGDEYIGDDACHAIMEELHGDEWRKGREESPECYNGDEYIGDEACHVIMEAKFAAEKEMMHNQKPEFLKRGESDKIMVIGEGGAEFVDKKELQNILEQAKNIEDSDMNEIEDLANSIRELEGWTEGDGAYYEDDDQYQEFDENQDHYQEEYDNYGSDYGKGDYKEDYKDYNSDYEKGEYKDYDEGYNNDNKYNE
ncbi:hypothetical protein HN695_00955 [Candidatus Woesearchaeota archaeon]|jgi:hypothetical protein|nr:hypothetical protein [Candidatus Woesearchaeota archaeon]MBT5272758.1 hypothetical protein [Candidatus Woesearchaeota archaeon]MBT6040370.1 hypothetical protein [Candidatus Woesearchaeota archaeon]MBT6336997.1 hypothetical protein [Candidatus Woesearchaeota archaeon]MBT7926883.1 hypothetical protein [Candidatus Woesearchaeota archaeon]